MQNISKAIGAIVGGIASTLVAINVVPAEALTPDRVTEVVGAIGTFITVVSAIATWLAPANKKPSDKS